ncbi:hypothetical protein ACI1US_00289 [Leucobacter sp. BZR 635]
MVDSNLITVVELRHAGEGTRILTPTGLLPYIEWVDWTGDTAEGLTVEVELHDETSLAGDGLTLVSTVWHEDADRVTECDLAESLPITALTRSASE